MPAWAISSSVATAGTSSGGSSAMSTPWVWPPPIGIGIGIGCGMGIPPIGIPPIGMPSTGIPPIGIVMRSAPAAPVEEAARAAAGDAGLRLELRDDVEHLVLEPVREGELRQVVVVLLAP